MQALPDFACKSMLLKEPAQILKQCQPDSEQLDSEQLEPTAEHRNCTAIASEPTASEAHLLEPPLDAAVLQEFRREMGSIADEVMDELIDCYLSETPQLCQSMQTAIAQQCPTRLHLAAHSLKSSSAVLGAMGLSRLCRRLEELAFADEVQQCAALLTQIQAEYGRVQIALRQIGGCCK